MRRPTVIPRHARIVVSGFPMHAILRGIDRAAIVFSDADDQTFLDAVAGLAATKAVHVHAYAMMTNHVHLLMTSESERGASQLMKGLGQRYPVRAHRVPIPQPYRCSSDRCNALGEANAVVTRHQLYLALAETDDARRAAYRNLFADAIPQDALKALRDATNGAFVLGSSRFQRQIAAMVGRRTRPRKSGRPKKETPDTSQLKLPL